MTEAHVTKRMTLRQCPFCGGTEIVWQSILDGPRGLYRCEGDDCFAEGPFGSTPQQAARRWNTRAEGHHP